jgi:hypothetical protein
MKCMVKGCDQAGAVWYGGTLLCATHAAMVGV